jgi:hypothetical protein
MSAKKPAADDKKHATVVADDPDDLKGTLKRIGGSQSDHWNNTLANQAINTLWLSKDAETLDRQYSATVAALIGIGPKDEIEGMIAAQLIAAHNVAMECYRRAMIREQPLEGYRENLSQANKLSRTYAVLLDALNRHRGKGQQKVTVEHVHVHSGGQAVVGTIENRGCRISGEGRGTTRCKKNCPYTSADDAERGREARASAGHQQCRTADAGCMGESRPAHRREIGTRSSMAAIGLRQLQGVVSCLPFFEA